MKKEKYIRPKIKEKKIKLSYFLTGRKRFVNQEELLFAVVPRPV